MWWFGGTYGCDCCHFLFGCGFECEVEVVHFGFGWVVAVVVVVVVAVGSEVICRLIALDGDTKRLY